MEMKDARDECDVFDKCMDLINKCCNKLINHLDIHEILTGINR